MLTTTAGGAAGLALAMAAFLAAAGPLLAHDHALQGPEPPAVMDFVPPGPGTYRLHAIMRAPDGRVVDVDGRPGRLSRFTTGKITLLGFVYTRCTDARGCPLAYQVFHAVREGVERSPLLRDQVRLVTLSFDPVNDTPEVMRRYAGRVGPGGTEWAFLTTRSPQELWPVLDGFGQDVRLETDERSGRPVPRTLSHVLKVFLIDRRGVVREIYTTSYLFPAVVLNDIETLRLESSSRPN